MRKILPLLSLILMLCLQFSFAQPLTYWVRSGGTYSADEAKDISVDTAGNTYTTGYYSSGYSPCGWGLTSAGVTDIFIHKNDKDGNLIWSVSAGGSGPDKGLSIKADAAGNTYITGYYQSSATFGSTTITAVGSSQDIFVAKYNSSGTLLWVRSAGGSGGDVGNGINVDNSGNVLVTGEFIGTATFGSYTLTSMIDPNTSLSSIDIFTAKYDSSGNILWVKQGAAPYTDRGLDVAADQSGNVYVTGQFSDTITFDAVHYNNIFNAIFLVKYDAAGNEQWFRKIGGGVQNIAYGIAAGSSGIYLTGDFQTTLVFFGSPNYTLTNSYTNCVFVSKYNDAGSLQWATANGSDAEVSSRSIAIDNSGNSYIIGHFLCKFSELADFYGQGTFNSVGYHDVFASKFNNSGVRTWSNQCGGRYEDYGWGISVNSHQQIEVAGSFEGCINFTSSPRFTSNGNSLYGPSIYCNDSSYNYYTGLCACNAADAFWGQAFDLSRAPYDYYVRSGNTCDRPMVGVCISNNNSTCPDTLDYCNYGFLSAISHIHESIGPSLNYVWSNSQNYYITSSGYHSVTQTSADGCFTSTDSVYVHINPLPPMPLISDSYGINDYAVQTQTINSCDSVILTGFPSAGMASFGWYAYFNSGGYISFPGILNDSITATQSGTYSFYVVDSLGCMNTNYVLVNITKSVIPVIGIWPPQQSDSIFTCSQQFYVHVYDSITDPNGNVLCGLDNIISSSWTSSPALSQYTFCSSDRAQQVFIFTSNGDYDIHVVLHRPCSSDSIVKDLHVYVQLNPTLTVTPSYSEVCQGDTVVLHVSGGSGYQWYGSGIIGPSNLDSVIVNQSGSYYVTSSDPRVCANSAYISNPYTIFPTVTMNPPSGLICPGDSVMLTTFGGLHYHWYGPSGLLPPDTSTIWVSTPGFYYCNVIEQCVEMVTNVVEVQQYTSPFIIALPSDVICAGGTATLHAIANEGSTIEWQAPLSGSDPVQVVSSAGTYSCSVTSCGIVTLATITISNSTVTSVITSSNPVLCSADSVVLTGNSGVSSYHWQPGNDTTQSIVIHQQGTYTLTTSDANGCTATSSVTINQGSGITVTGVSQNVTTPGGNDGSIDVTVTGGATPYHYLWNDGATTQDRSNLVAGIYTVTVTDDNGCHAWQNFTITQPSCNLEMSTTFINVSCHGGANGSINVSVTGAQGTVTYIWNDGATTQNRSGLTAGTYTVTGTDGGGCTGSRTVTIQAPSSVTISMSKTNVNLMGGHDGTATATPSGGTPGYTYHWSTGATTSGITNLTAGTYTVTVTDSHGCTASNSITINQPTCQFHLTQNHIDVSCYGGNNGSITIGIHQAHGAISFIWSDGATTQNRSGLTAGTYSVTAQDGNGCIAYRTVTIQQPSSPVSVSMSKTNVTTNGGSDGTATATASGGSPGYTYLWSNGRTTSTISNLTVGTYTVTVTDSHGCTASNNITVSLQQQCNLIVSGTTTNVSTSGGSDGAIDVTVTNGAPAYHYLWNDGATTEDRTGLTAGTYTVTVTDNNSCTAQHSFTVGTTQSCSLTLTGTVKQPKCFGGSNGSIKITVSGATGSVSYLWNNGTTTQNRTGLSTGTYTVTATDHAGCSAAISKIVSQPTAITITETHVNVSTPGGSNGSINITSTGGSGTRHYTWNDGVTTEDRSGLIAGTYTVTVTDGHSCTASRTIVITQPSGKEATSGTGGASMKLYPNPTQDKFSIELTTHEDSEKEYTVVVENILGQIIYSSQGKILNGLAKKEISFDEPIADGLYCVHVVIAGDKEFNGQLVVQH